MSKRFNLTRDRYHQKTIAKLTTTLVTSILHRLTHLEKLVNAGKTTSPDLIRSPSIPVIYTQASSPPPLPMATSRARKLNPAKQPES